MRSIWGSIVGASLLIVSPMNAASGKPPSADSAKSAKLEGMPYPRARRIILGYGWRALPGNCSGGGTTKGVCTRFPELGNCAGTGLGYCDMTFVRRQKCLMLVTTGGPPSDDTIVRDVTFSPAPCSKEP